MSDSRVWGIAAFVAGAIASAGSLLALAPGVASAFMAASFGFGVIGGIAGAREARKAANASLQDRITTIRATDEPRSILYGRGRTGGVLLYASPPYGSRNEKILVVYGLVGHPCDGFEQLWANDEIAEVDADGYVTGTATGKWRSNTIDFKAITHDAPPLWDAGSPSANLIAAPAGTTGVISVSYLAAPGDRPRAAVPGVDYDIAPNSFDVRNLNMPQVPGGQVTITYKGKYALDGYIRLWRFTGYETGDARKIDSAVAAQIEAVAPGELDRETATFDGICRIVVEMSYDPTVFADGVPEFSATLRGMRLYDPRKDSTNGGSGAHRFDDPSTWEFSRIGALCTAHYLYSDWGFGISFARLDWPSIIVAANDCATQIQIHPTDTTFTDYQFTVDGFLSTQSKLGDNLDELASAIDGFVAPVGAKWRIVVGAWHAPAADAVLNDRDVLSLSDLTISPFGEIADLYNSVSGRYRDDATYEVTDFPPYESNVYIAQDGGANDFAYSKAWASSGWSASKSGGASLPVVTPNYATAPDGTQTATRVVLSLAGASTTNDWAAIARADTPLDNVERTISCYVRTTAVGASVQAQMRLHGTTKTIAIDDTWRRVYVTGQSTGDGTTWLLALRGAAGTANDADILVWGWQRVIGAQAGLYRETNGAAARLPLYLPLDLPLTINSFRAQRLGRQRLWRHRAALRFAATCGLSAWPYQIGDRLRLRLSEYGWDDLVQDGGTGKVFMIEDRVWVVPNAVRLELVEDSAALYSASHSEFTIAASTPNTTLPSASDVAPPTGFVGSALAADFYTTAAGVQVGRLRLSWDAITDGSVLGGGWLEIEIKRLNDAAAEVIRVNPFDTHRYIESVRADETYNIGIRAINSALARSDLVPILGNVPELNLQNGVFKVAIAIATTAGGTVWSGNHVQNAGLQFSLDGFALFPFANPSYVVRATKAHPAAQQLVGPPAWNAMIEEQGSGAVASTAIVTAWAPSKLITCKEGERWGAALDFELDGCDAALGIAFYRSDDSFIPGAVTLSEKVVKAYVGASNAANYVRRTVFATAPQGAAGVRLLAYKYGTKSPAATSRMWVARPDLRELVGADAMPPWGAGAFGVVPTEALADSAATRTVRFEDAAGRTMLETEVATDVSIGTITCEAAGTVSIAVTCEVVCAGAISGAASELTLTLHQTGKIPLNPRSLGSFAAGSGAQPRPVTMAGSVVVAAGDVISPLLRLSRTRFGLGVGNTIDAVKKIEATLTLLKR